MRAEPVAVAATSAPRCDTVDVLRGVAVAAMVLGHTLDSVLTAEVRVTDWATTYWRLRGITGPFFLVVSGWALTIWVARTSLCGWALVRSRLPRVALLLAVGYLLRLPLGAEPGAAGFAAAWQRFLAFDALHCIAVSLLVTVALLAVVREPRLRLAGLGGLALLASLASQAVWQASDAAPLWVRQALGGGGGSPFPVVPYVGYFFTGAFVGVLWGGGFPERRRIAWLLTAGSVAALAAEGLGLHGLAPTSPTLFLYRVGEVLLVAGLVAALPLRFALTVAPLGRLALGVYVVHLVLLYGWARWPGLAGLIGQTLAAEAAFGLGFAILCVSVGAVTLWRVAVRWRLIPASRRRSAKRLIPAAGEGLAQ